MNGDVFERYSAYYDLLYRDKDYAAEAQYVTRTLRAASSGIRSVLEFGSGTGKHGRFLAGMGFQVYGVERSESMVAAARNTTAARPSGDGSFDCLQGDIQAVELGRAFDAVISLFHVVSYQTTNVALQKTFSNAARHLKPGGYFLFDVWHGPAVLRERPSVRVKRIEGDGTLLTRIAEPELDSNASTVTVHYTMLAEPKTGGPLVTFEEQHHMRYLFPTEIALFAEQAGLEIHRSEEFLTGKPPSESTWGVVYLLRKER